MKNLFFLLVAFIAVLFIACEKENDVTPSQKITVLMSAPKNQGLKSASTIADGPIEIQYGDTVDVWQLNDINIVLTAQNQTGERVNGQWYGYVSDADCFFTNSQNYFTEGGGSTASLKITTLGLYTVDFTPKIGDSFKFYIRNTGVPGEIGDSWQNKGAFRMESIQTFYDNKFHSGYTLFINSKNDEFISMNLDLKNDDNYFAIITCGGSNKIKIGEHEYEGLKQLKLKKSKYSHGYYYTSFMSDDAPPTNNGIYNVIFGIGVYGTDWMMFQSIHESSWSKNGWINFISIF